MMSPSIAVLGGSSPFTAGLIRAIAESDLTTLGFRLVLHGRSEQNLQLVRSYALRSGGFAPEHVIVTRSASRALEGATVVVHQIRYGGLEERGLDEDTALRHGASPDETLGPSGFRAALRLVPAIRRLAELVKRQTPDAWFANLTNPMSQAVRLLHRAGVRRAVGLCELPLATFYQACRLLRRPAANTTWEYAGLNHRGIIHALSSGGEDLLPELIQAAEADPSQSLDAELMRELSALPVKYYGIFSGRRTTTHRRAKVVEDLRLGLARRLGEPSQDDPLAATNRVMDWYPLAVVPFLRSVLLDDGSVQVVNRYDDALGIVRERKMCVFADHLEQVPEDAPAARVRALVDRQILQEQALSRAVDSPDRDRILAAVQLDAMIPPAYHTSLTEELFHYAERARSEPPWT